MVDQTEPIAVFDIGSNSIKMSVGIVGSSGDVEEIVQRAATTRLAQGIDKTGEMARDRIDESIDMLQHFALDARRLGAVRLIAVATEATRLASNGAEFLDLVAEETGIEVQEISGDQEASLTISGIDPTLVELGDVAVADTGGGSTEIVVVSDAEIVCSLSLPIGSGRMTDQYVQHDPPRDSELRLIRDRVAEQLVGVSFPNPADALILVGGTAEYLRRLLEKDWPVALTDVADVLQFVTTIPSTELAIRVGASVERAKVLPAGIAIGSAIADSCSATAISGAASGIRRGMLLAAFRGEL